MSLIGRALAEAPREIRIPAGPLVTALESLQKQATVELVYRAEQLRPFRTSGVSGSYSPQDAVRILLQGTPLQVRIDSSGAMVIVMPAIPTGRTDQAPNATAETSPAGVERAAAPPVALEEIVVTAQKRSENILSVPASVAFIASDTLEAQHATQLQDYAAAVAGLQVDSQGSPGQTTITLRGIAASTTGTDADWIVKLLDVYPDTGVSPELRGRSLIIADEVFRGRYWSGFEHPVALPPGKVLPYSIDLHSASHVFKKGHRIAVQIQSTWFPLIDRNPQTFQPSIFLADPSQYQAQTHSVYHTGELPSAIVVDVAEDGAATAAR